MTPIHRKAHAKINLALDVLSRRPDGYHEVRMVMHAIDLHDELTFEAISPGAGSPWNHPPVRLVVSGPAAAGVPDDDTNLACRAARMVLARYRPREGVLIRLMKNIPAAAGLGGGSADAAAVFHGLNELYGLGMTGGEMAAMGRTLGADIPFCLIGGTAIAEGIGERLTPLPPLPPCRILLETPAIHVSTRSVFEDFIPKRDSARGPDIAGMAAAIRRGDLTAITARMDNVLETVTQKRHPEIRAIKDGFLARGAMAALMSGSGPTVFAIFAEEDNP